MSKTMLFNPYTGTPRHPSDIQSDPEGILLLDPDEPVRAALAAAPQPSADPWRDAVEQMLAITEQVASDDPRKSIHRLIDWYVSVALDPLVSSDARALVQRGRDEVATQPSDEPESTLTAGRMIATRGADGMYHFAPTAQPSAEPIDLTIERLRDALVASRIILPEAVEDPDGYDDGLTLFRIEGLHRRLAGAQPSALKLEQPK